MYSNISPAVSILRQQVAITDVIHKRMQQEEEEHRKLLAHERQRRRKHGGVQHAWEFAGSHEVIEEEDPGGGEDQTLLDSRKGSRAWKKLSTLAAPTATATTKEREEYAKSKAMVDAEEAEEARLGLIEADRRKEEARPIYEKSLPAMWLKFPGFGAGLAAEPQWEHTQQVWHKARVFNLKTAPLAKEASERQISSYEDYLIAMAGLGSAERGVTVSNFHAVEGYLNAVLLTVL